ncbi:MAG: multicopper oxidase family protein [Rhodobacteraceae bacterium]|nr:MAG: multicopper oxidase family protein [Paracoccaceae bacterium]
MISRRLFLASTAALAVTPRLALAAPQVLRAGVTRAQLAPDGYGDTEVWAFDDRIPGPDLRVAQGARLARRVQNDLPVHTAVHWHGIRIDNAMDGVPGLTQRAIEPGESFDYDFVTPDAGTFWYHSHQHSMEQVGRGLKGPLIVTEAEAPDVDRDLVLMLDDWRLDPRTTEFAPFGNRHDLSHAGRIGNLITVNGVFDWRAGVRAGDRLRLRFINAASARIFTLDLRGLDTWVMALDGMPLTAPLRVDFRLELAPGQRVDVIADVTAPAGALAEVVSLERDGGYSLAAFDVAAGGAARGAAPVALAPNPVARPGDLASAPLYTMRLEGGAMRGLGPSMHEGRLTEPQDLYAQEKFWALSGHVDLPDIPVIDAARGDTHRIAMVNETAFPHGMHLHGHHFHVLDADGGLGPLRDTVLVAPGQTRQIAFVADNPGDWLLHCHMLGHAQAGMKTWYRVS